MSANDLIYNLGQTNIAIPAGVTATQIIPPRTTKSIAFKYASGGSLAVVNALSGITATNGYILGTTEVVSLNGPVSFFLAASGSTAVASVLFGYSAGYSSLP